MQSEYVYLKGQSHSRSRTNHSQITHRLGLCVLVRREIDQFFGVSGIEITDESRMNHAWTAHVSLTITDESLTYRARRRIRANTVHYYTPTLLYARITHFQPCTITQISERISGQIRGQIRVFARILGFCPHTPFRPSPGFANDYCIVTSYLNAFIVLLNYNDICLYKQYAIRCQQNVSALWIRWSY